MSDEITEAEEVQIPEGVELPDPEGQPDNVEETEDVIYDS